MGRKERDRETEREKQPVVTLILQVYHHTYVLALFFKHTGTAHRHCSIMKDDHQWDTFVLICVVDTSWFFFCFHIFFLLVVC
jgi:hypothetical protein